MKSGSLQLIWQFSTSEFVKQLPPISKDSNPEYLCDLGKMTEKGFELITSFLPNSFSGVLNDSGSIRLEMAALAENARSRSLKLEITWDGEWVESHEEMQEHLAIKEIE